MVSFLGDMIEINADALEGFESLEQMGMTDGLPVIPPTIERVTATLSSLGSEIDGDEVVGVIPPRNTAVSLATCAVNTVMAGCRPEYFPVVVAAVRAMLTPGWDLHAIQSTTNPKTPFVLLNGPFRHQIGVNCGTGAMGPGTRSNVTIGRALRLILLNAGGAHPGVTDMCTQGFVGKFSLMVGENEEDSPWDPYHVDQGYRYTDSVVTVVAINASVNIHDSSDSATDVLHTLERSFYNSGSLNFLDPNNTSVLALNPVHAQILSDAGFGKARLREHLFESVRMSIDELSKRRRHLRSVYGEGLADSDSLSITGSPENLRIIVVGGSGGGHSSFFPNGINGYATSVPVPTNLQ